MKWAAADEGKFDGMVDRLSEITYDISMFSELCLRRAEQFGVGRLRRLFWSQNDPNMTRKGVIKQ